MIIKRAIIRLSGREVLVNENEVFPTFSLNQEVGTSFELPATLCFDENNKIVEGKVTISVMKKFLGNKVHCLKKKNRTRTTRLRGSRPHLAMVKIDKIQTGKILMEIGGK